VPIILSFGMDERRKRRHKQSQRLFAFDDIFLGLMHT
jgi:hypothetical protein